MYDKKVVRRRRAALALFVGLSVLLLTIYFGESAGGGFHAVQRGAQEVLAPIEAGASRALKPVRDLAGWTGDVLDAKGENEELEEEVTRLRQEVARAQTDAHETAQLRALVGPSRREGYPDGVEAVAARVIAQSPTVWYSAVQIDKGSDDGVKVDQPVVSGAGLAGKVTGVTSGTARVTLITDASSAVSAQVLPDGTKGILKPEVGDPDDLLLDFIEKGRDIKNGSTVVTAGSTSSRLESLFPRGIPIGKVTRVEPDELELYQRVHLKPFAELRHLELVQVLTSKPDTARAEVGTP